MRFTSSGYQPESGLPGGLPLADIEHGTTWWRIHKTPHALVFFGPAPGDPPTYRFDASGGEYRILYVGQTLSAAYVETLPRNSAHPIRGADRDRDSLREYLDQ